MRLVEFGLGLGLDLGLQAAQPIVQAQSMLAQLGGCGWQSWSHWELALGLVVREPSDFRFRLCLCCVCLFIGVGIFIVFDFVFVLFFKRIFISFSVSFSRPSSGFGKVKALMQEHGSCL